ncbi:MAG TPA: KGG domain-containing protein [Polyangiaceae bacterium]|nr:KGG domain-containing protein [Polyangiaceae bacterium]
MNTTSTDTQFHMTSDTDTHVSGNETHSVRGEAQELTPDRPPQPVDETEPKAKRPRGFAAMDRKQVSEIARKGGKAAHSAGTAHEFTSEEARVAGRKGGRATHAKRRKVSEDTTEKVQPEGSGGSVE